jgi:hypothetical protein
MRALAGHLRGGLLPRGNGVGGARRRAGHAVAEIGGIGQRARGREDRVKSNAEVRSPHTARRHALMLGSRTPKRRSRKRRTEVWSNSSEQTKPPRLHGETSMVGVRMPSPMGWRAPCSAAQALSADQSFISPSSGTVLCPR